MNRNIWEFKYPTTKLLDAATLKCNHHSGRLKFWEDQKQTVIDSIRREGIDVDESLSNMTSSAYRGSSVQVRTDLVRDLDECVQKIREHRAKVEEYDAWVQVLSSQAGESFSLHQDDWLFFFGK